MSDSRSGPAINGRTWEAALVVILLGLAMFAWLITARLAAPGMRSGILSGPEPMMSMSSAPGGSAAVIGLFLVTWLVMMVAMMLPAVAPVVVTLDRWARRTGRPRRTAFAFVGGYLAAWTASGVLVYAAARHLGPLLPSGAGALRSGGAIMILAGAYQLTRLKEVCLRHCRSPLAFVARHADQLRRGDLNTARVGAIHGGYCLGCCWALMLVLALLGLMSLVWMAAVAAVIFCEKVLPRGPLVSHAVALLLITVGTFLVISPRALPPLP